MRCLWRPQPCPLDCTSDTLNLIGSSASFSLFHTHFPGSSCCHLHAICRTVANPVPSVQASAEADCLSLQMATLDKAEHLLEDLRKASFDTAKQELEDIKDFARQQVR